MTNSKIHWFKTDVGEIYAVIVNRSRLISPLKFRDYLSAHSVYQQALYKLIKDHPTGIKIRVILDAGVQAPSGLDDIRALMPPKIAEKISDFDLVGQYAISESINELTGVEEHEFLRRRLKDMMKNLSELAPLDSTGRKLLMLKSRRYLMESDFFTVIENDPALSAQLMNWSCSAYYTSSAPAKNIHDAVRRILGIEQALILSIGLSIQKSFKIEKGLKKYLDAYIRRSIYVASMAQYISEESSVNHNKDSIYLGGMLHNLGELILMQISPGLYRHIAAYLLVNPGHRADYVQQHILQMTFSDIGVILGQQWELPKPIVKVMSDGQMHLLKPGASADDKIIALSQEWLAAHGHVNMLAGESYMRVAQEIGLGTAGLENISSRFYAKLEYSNILITSISS
ncbi:MAG: HDOD domain-containing protein [Hafnia sp.]